MKVDLVLLKKNGSQEIFPLPRASTVIGRQHNCDLFIPLMSISRKHCQFKCSRNTVRLRDLDSSNGTNVNGKPIEEVMVRAGDSIKIGPLTFVLRINGKPAEAKLSALAEQGPSDKDEETGIFDSQFATFADLEDSQGPEALD